MPVLDRIGRILAAVAWLLAILGGVVLTAMALLTVTSVIRRELGFGAILGDVELVELGAATAVFCFLPWCQLQRGHVTVDILVQRFPERLHLLLTSIGHLTLATVGAVITYRVWLGLGEKLRYGDQTFILGAPIWPGYVAGVVGGLLFTLIALQSALTPRQQPSPGAAE
ncbi:MAG: TRAP transporter small permease [Pseudomonadota bacterium]